jgi:hypothetical protein
MDPIVNGIKQQYAACMDVLRVNYHQRTEWHELIYPVASPEFALLDSDHNILYRWFGVFEAEEFTAILDPLCVG